MQIVTVPLAIYVFVYDGRVASHFSSENNTPTFDLPFIIRTAWSSCITPSNQIQSHRRSPSRLCLVIAPLLPPPNTTQTLILIRYIFGFAVSSIASKIIPAPKQNTA